MWSIAASVVIMRLLDLRASHQLPKAGRLAGIFGGRVYREHLFFGRMLSVRNLYSAVLVISACVVRSSSGGRSMRRHCSSPVCRAAQTGGCGESMLVPLQFQSCGKCPVSNSGAVKTKLPALRSLVVTQSIMAGNRCLFASKIPRAARQKPPTEQHSR